MSSILLTVPLPTQISGAKATTSSTGFESADNPLTLEYLDDNGRHVGQTRHLPMPPLVAVETPGPKGALTWQDTRLPLALRDEPPSGATCLQVRAPGGFEAKVRLESAVAPRAPDAQRWFGKEEATWTLAVVAERFGNQDMFFNCCQSLYDRFVATPPFNDPDLPFGIVGLFWRSDPTQGLFDAQDSRINDRVLQGNGQRVHDFVAMSPVRPAKILVIVNSSIRAGAGGQKRDIPSWVTTHADYPERWEQIAIHEVGHAFGLADEYSHPYELAEPNPLEPNISKNADPLSVRWHLLCSEKTPAPTLPYTEDETVLDQFDRSVVGTFEGARYKREGRYRPSANCCMRVTYDPFCRVCEDHIRRTIQAEIV